MSLTEFEIKAAKPREKAYSLSDGRGLLLDVRPNGGKYWVARVWVRGDDGTKGKEKRKGLGVWPEISLRQARELMYEIKKKPSKDSAAAFGPIADEWMDRIMKPSRSLGYVRTLELRFKKYILPEFKHVPMDEITSGQVFALCHSIEDKGYAETAGRVRRMISQVFDYAISSDRAKNNPATPVAKILTPHKTEHYATVEGTDSIGLLMRSIDAYPHDLVRMAMLFSALTFCRPGEVRQAEWREIDVKKKLWTIPAEKMKMRVEHVVPLSKQAITVLEQLKKFSGEGRFLFPSSRADGRPLSDGTVRVALRTMGYEKEDMTAHGFRAMASTVLNEYGWSPDMIETQLAHGETDSIRAAYNRAAYFSARLAMMQWWADFLDAVRDGAKIPKKPKITVRI